MGDSHFCKWEFEFPKEYSEKPTKQKRKGKSPNLNNNKPLHWSRKCFSGHWSVWAVPVSVCFCSGLCTELCLSPSCLSQTLRASSVELLTESLLFFFGFHPCSPCAGPCASPVLGIAWNILGAGDRFPVIPCRGYGCAASEQLEERFCLLTQ